jgi:hypothetical protein
MHSYLHKILFLKKNGCYIYGVAFVELYDPLYPFCGSYFVIYFNSI